MARANQYRSMWDRASRRRRSRALPMLAALGAVVAVVTAALYWTESWMFERRPPPVELSAITTAPAEADPVVATDPGEPASTPDAPDAPETRPSTLSAVLDEAAEGELRQLRGGDADTLRRKLGTLVIDPRFSRESRAAWLVEARELSRRVVFSASPMKHALMVPVKSGDTLLGICGRVRRDQKVSVTPRFLELVNDVSAKRLRAGMTLKVPVEPMSILVDKDEYRLYVLLGGCFLKDYEVGIGRDQRTPEGRFTIGSMTKNPQWTDPETGRVHKFGDPEHVIGTRWMGFAGEHGRTGFGIHGTTDPASVGRAESAGCIRMRKDDVEELYDLVPQGAEVVIRR